MLAKTKRINPFSSTLLSKLVPFGLFLYWEFPHPSASLYISTRYISDFSRYSLSTQLNQVEKAKSTCDLFSLAATAGLKPESFWMCLPTCALMLLILLISVRNSFQPIEQLRKVNGNSQRGVSHYKAHCLCNLPASIFPSKPRGQRWQLHKPASELLIKNLNCTKAIRMLAFHWLFHALSGACVVVGHMNPQVDKGACSSAWVAGAGGRLGCVPAASLKPRVSLFHHLHLQCSKGNAPNLRHMNLYSSYGTWKRWKRLKSGPVYEQTDSGLWTSCSGKGALSHIMPLLEETSHTSAFAHWALEKSAQLSTGLPWPSGWSWEWSVLPQFSRVVESSTEGLFIEMKFWVLCLQKMLWWLWISNCFYSSFQEF